MEAVVGTGVGVLVGSGVAVGVGEAEEEPPNGDRQAVMRKVSNMRGICFWRIMSFPCHISLRAAK